MPRTTLDTGLRELHSQILTLAWAVEAAFTSTLKALELGEHHRLPQIIEQNVSIDAMCEVAQQQALRLLILQQPSVDRDLRFLTRRHCISAIIMVALAMPSSTCPGPCSSGLALPADGRPVTVFS